jgi:hypothetical protein
MVGARVVEALKVERSLVSVLWYELSLKGCGWLSVRLGIMEMHASRMFPCMR